MRCIYCIENFIIFDNTGVLSKCDFSLHWKLSEGCLAFRTFRYIGHRGMFIVQDASLYWTRGCLFYVRFGHWLRDNCSIARFVIMGNV
jgi:hypothetical protein